MMKLKWNRISALLIIAMFLGFPSCAGDSFATQKKRSVAKAGQVIELRRIDQLKEVFQRDAGKIRFVTILSPT